MHYILKVGGGKMTNGREDKKSNDLFFTCSLIEYISRKTHNHPSATVKALGRERLFKIYDLADIYHSDNIDRVTEDFVEESGLTEGNFDNITPCKYSVPTHWDIGKVYKRLILAANNGDIIDTLIEVYTSPIVDLIEDYNSSFYYDNPGSIYATYQNGCIPEGD